MKPTTKRAKKTAPATKRGRGRPMRKSTPSTVRVVFRVTAVEHDALLAAAFARGLKLAEYLRQQLKVGR